MGMKKDFLLKEQEDEALQAQGGAAKELLRQKPLIFSVADCVGSERNATTPECWGSRQKMGEKFSSEYLSKRGCSGVKVYSVPATGICGMGDVLVDVPVGMAHLPAVGVQLAAGDWSVGQMCMACDVEEARIFSVKL